MKNLRDCKYCVKTECRDNQMEKYCYEDMSNFELKLSSENLWDIYHNGENWPNINKSHENLFRIGVESVMMRGEGLLNQFFNHKSDANKYLMADEQEDLMKEFGEWCQKTVRE